MKRTIAGITLLAALLAAGCAAKAYDPFRISPEEFRRRVKTVAVARVAVPGNVGDAATASAKFHPAIEAKLREAGFTVVPSEQVREVWDAKANELGGLFDQQTGSLNEAKASALMEHVRGEMKSRFAADALALPHVRTVTANFSSALFAGIDAKWDGASESVVTGSFDKVLSPPGQRQSPGDLALRQDRGPQWLGPVRLGGRHSGALKAGVRL
jgi:hypothetical protein